MSYVVADGKSNWLEGVILISTSHIPLYARIVSMCPIGLYLVIAVTFWFYPGAHIFSP